MEKEIKLDHKKAINLRDEKNFDIFLDFEISEEQEGIDFIIEADRHKEVDKLSKEYKERFQKLNDNIYI